MKQVSFKYKLKVRKQSSWSVSLQTSSTFFRTCSHFPIFLAIVQACPGTIRTKTPIRSAKTGATQVPKAQPDDENKWYSNHPALGGNWHAGVLGNMAIFFKDFQNHCRTPVHPPQGLSIFSVSISKVKSWTFAHGTSTIHQLATCLKSSGKSREFLSTSTSIFRSWSVSRWWLSMTIVCVSETSVAWRCSFVCQISLVLMFQYWHPLGDAAACKWWQECGSTSGNLMNHIKWPYANQYKIITQRKGSSRMRLHKTVLGIYGFDELSCFNTWNPGAKSVNLLGLLSAKPKWICSPGNIYGVISLVIQHLPTKSSPRFVSKSCIPTLSILPSHLGKVMLLRSLVEWYGWWKILHPLTGSLSHYMQYIPKAGFEHAREFLQGTSPKRQILMRKSYVWTCQSQQVAFKQCWMLQRNGFWCAVFPLNLLSWYRLCANMRVHNLS